MQSAAFDTLITDPASVWFSLMRPLMQVNLVQRLNRQGMQESYRSLCLVEMNTTNLPAFDFLSFHDINHHRPIDTNEHASSTAPSRV